MSRSLQQTANLNFRLEPLSDSYFARFTTTFFSSLTPRKIMAGNEVYLLWILAGTLVLVGLAGTILPMLPGVPFVFGGLLVAAWIDNFQRIGWPILTILALLTAMALVVDFVATVFGAKRAGASKLALVGAAIGSIVGIFFGLIGIFIFPFVGAVIGEFIERRKLGQAGKVGLATWLGLLFGALAKLALALTMIGIFVIAYLWK
jgi:uncharacterized protein